MLWAQAAGGIGGQGRLERQRPELGKLREMMNPKPLVALGPSCSRECEVPWV